MDMQVWILAMIIILGAVVGVKAAILGGRRSVPASKWVMISFLVAGMMLFVAVATWFLVRNGGLGF